MNSEPEVPQKLEGRHPSVYHIPVLNDMNDYQAWNEKLAKRMNSFHKKYKRFIKGYGIKDHAYIEFKHENRKVPYSANITKHLLGYDNSDPSVRFTHVQMNEMNSETLSIANIFEEMNGQNPLSSKTDTEIQALNDLAEAAEENDGEGEGEGDLERKAKKEIEDDEENDNDNEQEK